MARELNPVPHRLRLPPSLAILVVKIRQVSSVMIILSADVAGLFYSTGSCLHAEFCWVVLPTSIRRLHQDVEGSILEFGNTSLERKEVVSNFKYFIPLKSGVQFEVLFGQ